MVDYFPAAEIRVKCGNQGPNAAGNDDEIPATHSISSSLEKTLEKPRLFQCCRIVAIGTTSMATTDANGDDVVAIGNSQGKPQKLPNDDDSLRVATACESQDHTSTSTRYIWPTPRLNA
jgi:hypothetical protein